MSVNWIAAPYRYLDATEQQNNAVLIYRYFIRRGWTINAIAAMIANMEVESTLNPGIWESLIPPEQFLTENGRNPGFGLVQWTPYTKYTEWAGEGWENNYLRQLDRIIWELENGEQFYPTTSYPETFREFSQSTKSAYYLAGAFLYNYERPKNPNADARGQLGEKWFAYLQTVDPGLTTIPVWLLFKLKERCN